MSELLDSAVVAPLRSPFRSAVGAGLVALRRLPPGATILVLEGCVAAAPTRYSVQVGEAEHLAPPAAAAADDERYGWRLLNHSCVPNAALLGRLLVARRAIAPGEEITFDYLTTEFDMAAPFPCGCGAAHCVGVVRGYRHLDPAQRARLAPRAAPHVLALARRHGLC